VVGRFVSKLFKIQKTVIALVMLFPALLELPVHAEPKPLQTGPVDLTGALYFNDEEQMLDAAAIMTMDAAQFSRTIRKGENTFGYGDSYHWVRWEFSVTDATKGLLFAFNTGYQFGIDFVVFREDGSIYSQERLDVHSNQIRPVLPTFQLPTEVGSYTAVIGVWSPYLGNFSAEIGDVATASVTLAKVSSTSALYCGILLILIAYHLLVLFKMRMRIVAAYLYFATAMMFGVVTVSGQLDMIAPLKNETWAHLGPISRCIPVLGLLWFGYELLARAKQRFWKRSIAAVAAFASVSIGAVAVGGAKFLLLNDVANLLALVVMMMTGLAGVWHRERFSSIYVLALSCFVAGVSVWTLGNAGFIPQTYWVANAPLFANLFEIMLLTVVFSQYVDNVKQVQIEATEARNADEHKARLLRVIGHDLQNPLMVMRMQHERLLKKHSLESMAELGQDIAKSVNSSLRLVNQMQDIVNRVKQMISDKSGLQSHIKSESLRTLIEDVAFLYLEQAKQKDVSLQVEIPEGEWNVFCDPASVRSQILGNFVGNAVKFSPVGGAVSLKVSNFGQDRIRIEIRDSGEGIPPDVIRDMFRTNRVGSTDGTSGERGSGFGLAIAVQTANMIGAIVHVESHLRSEGAPNHGTVISVTFLRGSDESQKEKSVAPAQNLTAA